MHSKMMRSEFSLLLVLVLVDLGMADVLSLKVMRVPGLVAAHTEARARAQRSAGVVLPFGSDLTAGGLGASLAPALAAAASVLRAAIEAAANAA
jgi:hypothetical protein